MVLMSIMVEFRSCFQYQNNVREGNINANFYFLVG